MGASALRYHAPLFQQPQVIADQVLALADEFDQLPHAPIALSQIADKTPA